MQRDRLKGMVPVAGGRFRMGSEDFYPEERPVRDASAPGFWMDEHPVTVAQFRRFVRDTGYMTFAERSPDPALDIAPSGRLTRRTTVMSAASWMLTSADSTTLVPTAA